jgi:putative Holliday junction resolvase
MPVFELTELPDAIPRGAPIMGLDLGEKTIGVAISDVGLMIATPTHLLRKTKFTTDAEALLALMQARDAAALVIGLPVNMDGTEGPRCQ